VHQLLHVRNFAQRARSRTVYTNSNVQVWPGDADNEALVCCNLVLYELRKGHYQQPRILRTIPLTAGIRRQDGETYEILRLSTACRQSSSWARPKADQHRAREQSWPYPSGQRH
jgi:hypothetical protein